MRTVTIEVASLEDTQARMKAAFRGEPQGCFISFPSHEDLWTTLTPNRWGILKAIDVGLRKLGPTYKVLGFSASR